MFRHFKFSFIWTLAGILIPAVMIVASRWQWSRYLEKQELVETYSNHSTSAPIEFHEGYSQFEDNLYKKHRLSGVFDYEHQFALRNRKAGSGPGFHLFTPLRVSDNLAVLVSRGFIPYADYEPESWGKYSYNPGASTEVLAVLQPTVKRRSFLSPDNPQTTAGGQERFFLFPDVERIATQIPYEIYLPGYFQRLGPPQVAENKFPEEAVSIRVPPETHYWYSYEWIALAFTTFFACLFVQVYGKKIEERRAQRLKRFEQKTTLTEGDKIP